MGLVVITLLDAPVTLAKFASKGGWTYAAIPALPVQVKTHFGVLKASGSIDGVALENVALMPVGNGLRILPVNAALRKQLGKQAGDVVHLRLHTHNEPELMTVSLADIVECLAQESAAALGVFQQLSPAQQHEWLHWLNQADGDDQKVARMEQAIAQLALGAFGRQGILPPK